MSPSGAAAPNTTASAPTRLAMLTARLVTDGPGSISEAVAMKLPVIVERNVRTLPQERYNADWIREHCAGIVLESFRDIAPAVHRMIHDLERFRANVAKIENRAVYEIPEILEGVLRKTRA